MKFDRDKFSSAYQNAFGAMSASQKTAIEFLLGAFEADDAWQNVHEVAYALATVKHECANTYLPITEHGDHDYFHKYDGRHDLGNTHPGDGYLFRGRGFVQITGRVLYRRFGIENVPDKALEPTTAFAIMSVGMHVGSFTGKKLSQFFSNGNCDYKNARRIINGLDKAVLIAGYAHVFDHILTVSTAVSRDVDDNRSDAASDQAPPSIGSAADGSTTAVANANGQTDTGETPTTGSSSGPTTDDQPLTV